MRILQWRTQATTKGCEGKRREAKESCKRKRNMQKDMQEILDMEEIHNVYNTAKEANKEFLVGS